MILKLQNSANRQKKKKKKANGSSSVCFYYEDDCKGWIKGAPPQETFKLKTIDGEMTNSKKTRYSKSKHIGCCDYNIFT